VQAALLQQLGSEPVHAVRRAAADVGAAVAKLTLPGGAWPELMDFLAQCSQSSQAEHREVALLLFASLTETVGACRGVRVRVRRSPTNSPLEGAHVRRRRGRRCCRRRPPPANTSAPQPPRLPRRGERGRRPSLAPLPPTQSRSRRPRRAARPAVLAGDVLMPHLGSIVQVVGSGLGDARPLVHMAALRSIEPLLPMLQLAAASEGAQAAAAKAAGGQLAAALLHMGGAALASQQEEALVLVCQGLLGILESPEALLGPLLPQASTCSQLLASCSLPRPLVVPDRRGARGGGRQQPRARRSWRAVVGGRGDGQPPGS